MFLRKIRRRKWCCIICISFFLLFLTNRMFTLLFKLTTTHLTELHTCPYCYGHSACSIVNNNLIDIHHSILYSALFGTKNVYYANFNQSKIVLKKLASNNELDDFDLRLHNNKTYLLHLFLNKINNYDNIHLLLSKEMTSDILDLNIKLRLCPNAKNIKKLLHNVNMTSDINDIKFSYVYIWTMLKINPEPLILQILPAEDGWPVPHFYGACGRLVIEEFVGLPLTYYNDVSWIRRAKIASNLLAAAYMFTFGHIDFAFYLTDVSWDNIAVDSNDNVKFIDLENIIVVDKTTSSKDVPALWNETHRSESFTDCENCLAFSVADICNHKLSDHNYYAICQHIISQPRNSVNQQYGSLLHDIPINIAENFPNLMNLLQQCFNPYSPSDNRIIFGIELKNTLEKIITIY